MEFLSQALQRLKPQANWNSFQEAKAIGLSTNIRALEQTQKASNQFAKLLTKEDSKKASTLLRENLENGFSILGADAPIFQDLVKAHPNLYIEYSKIIKRLLEKDNLEIVLREYGTIPILTNLSILAKKEILSPEQYLNIIKSIYSPATLKSFIALSELIKIASLDKLQEVLQMAIEQGIFSIDDLASDKQAEVSIRNFIKIGPEVLFDKYTKNIINDVFEVLKNFFRSVNQILKTILKNEIKEEVG